MQLELPPSPTCSETLDCCSYSVLGETRKKETSLGKRPSHRNGEPPQIIEGSH